MAQHNASVTPGVNLTRGVPFEPGLGAQERGKRIVEREKRIAEEERKKARREEMRAYGRKLDEQARQERIKRQQINAAYRERYFGEES